MKELIEKYTEFMAHWEIKRNAEYEIRDTLMKQAAEYGFYHSIYFDPPQFVHFMEWLIAGSGTSTNSSEE